MNDGRAVLLFFAPVHNFDAFPVGHMPILTFAEAAVHHAGCAQERHVTLMQTRQRPANSGFGACVARLAWRHAGEFANRSSSWSSGRPRYSSLDGGLGGTRYWRSGTSESAGISSYRHVSS